MQSSVSKFQEQIKLRSSFVPWAGTDESNETGGMSSVAYIGLQSIVKVPASEAPRSPDEADFMPNSGGGNAFMVLLTPCTDLWALFSERLRLKPEYAYSDPGG